MKMERKELRASLLKAADGRITVVASDESVDRHGEVVPAGAWDLSKFSMSPRLLVDHDYRVQAIVGKCLDTRVEGGKLLFSPEFHAITDVAKACSEMVAQGYLDTVSVGFVSKKGADGSVVNELIEISFVAVPANANARIVAEAFAKSVASAEQDRAVEDFVGKGAVADILDEEEKRRRKGEMMGPVWDVMNALYTAYYDQGTEPEAFGTMLTETIGILQGIAAGGEAGDEDEGGEEGGEGEVEAEGAVAKLVGSPACIRVTDGTPMRTDDGRAKLQEATDALKALAAVLGKQVGAPVAKSEEVPAEEPKPKVDGGGQGGREGVEDVVPADKVEDKVEMGFKAWKATRDAIRRADTLIGHALGEMNKGMHKSRK